jgi:hypothetical protein
MLWAALGSWVTVGVIVPVVISIGVGVMSLSPPEFMIARAAFCISALILAARVTWWLGVEIPNGTSLWLAAVVAFVIFGALGSLLVGSLSWISARKVHIESTQAPPLVSPPAARKEAASAKEAGTAAPKRVTHHGTGVAPIQPARAERHLTEAQISSMKAALGRYPAGEIAIYPLRDRPERLRFAVEIANVFRAMGWTLLVRNDHQPSDPEYVSVINRIDKDPAGVSLLEYKDGDRNYLRAMHAKSLDAILETLRAGRLLHQELPYNNIEIPRQPISTDTPVLFVGPATETYMP